MSLYQVDKLLFQLFNDLELQRQFKQDPAIVLQRYELQDNELEALRKLDAGALYRMGAHTFLLGQFARMMELSPAVYFKQVRGA